MMTSWQIINDKNLKQNEAIKQAVYMLNPPYRDEEQYASAKCFLTYRCAERNITFEYLLRTFIDSPDEPEIKDKGLACRWFISQKMAEIYIHIQQKDWDNFYINTEAIQTKFVTEGHFIWPPTVINFLRSKLLYFYYYYLNGQDKGTLHDYIGYTIESWKICVDHTNFNQFPYRFSEMREDCIELQALMFLLDATRDKKEMEVYDWMNPKVIEKHWRPLMKEAMKTIGQLNPSKAIWK